MITSIVTMTILMALLLLIILLLVLLSLTILFFVSLHYECFCFKKYVQHNYDDKPNFEFDLVYIHTYVPKIVFALQVALFLKEKNIECKYLFNSGVSKTALFNIVCFKLSANWYLTSCSNLLYYLTCYC